VPPVVQAAYALGWPGHDMGYAGCHFLLTAGAPKRPRRAGTADPANEPLAVAVRLTAFDPADGSVKVEPGVLTASAMGSGHGSSVGGLHDRRPRHTKAHEYVRNPRPTLRPR
jgi:hypothetical protein